jgi:hypothetical protein
MDGGTPRRGGRTAALLLAAAAGIPFAAGQSPPDASVAEARLPARLQCGETFRASITMQNTGTTTWTSTDALGAVGGEDVFTEALRVNVAAGVEVAPGESHTFRFPLTAPEIALPQARTAWRMVSVDGIWFGETAAQAIEVDCPPRIDDAEMLQAQLPSRLACGQSQAARVTVRNAGTTRWSSRDGYVLVAIEGADDFHVPGPISLPEGAVVRPAGVHTFTTSLVAPDSAGGYRLEFQMARSGGGYFGPTLEQSVKVVCEPRAKPEGGAEP